jgi:tetratricopeptide (TPR) repeat protein
MSIKSFVSAHILKIIARSSVLILFFLLPIFFLNFSIEILETSKQLLLIVLTTVVLLSWLGAVLAEKKLACRGWITNFLPLLFLLAALLSSIFSLAGYRTWVGGSSQEYTSFLTLLSFVAIFYVVGHLAADQGFSRKFFRAGMFSAVLASLLAWPHLFGWDNLSLLPEGLSNSVGSVASFAIYLSALGILGLGAWLSSEKRNLFVVFSTIVVLGTALLFCLSIGFWMLWLFLALAFLLLIGWFFKKEAGKGKLIVLIILFFASLLLIFLPPPIKLKTSVVITPSFNFSWNITKQVLLDNPRQLFLGTGPGTFVYDYAKYKSLDINETILWSLNFDRAKPNLLTSLSTLGILSVGLWLVFVILLLVKIFGRKIDLVFAAPWLVLLAGQIFYTSNLTLGFLFWSLSAILAAQLPMEKEIHFSKSPRVGLVFSFAFAAVCIVSAAALFFVGSRYASEVAFVQAVRLDQAGAPAEQVTAKIGQAVSYNKFSDLYYKNYSQAIFKQLNSTLNDYSQDGYELDESEKAVIQKLLLASITASDRAVQLAPNDVSAWNQRGKIYGGLFSLVGESEDVAATSYQMASKLEPANPSHLVNLGKLYLMVADRAIKLSSSEDAELASKAKEAVPVALSSAEEYLNQAISLKADYTVAHYYLAAVYERQNKIEEAIVRIEGLLRAKPDSVGIWLQLSLLKIKLGDYETAQNYLEKLVAARPNYSNARWYLAAIYEADKDFDQAIEQVSKILELNPENQTVIARLDDLRAGKALAEMPPPPLEEENNESGAEIIE